MVITVSATMFPEVGKQGNIDKKHNVSAKMFPSLARALSLKRVSQRSVESHGFFSSILSQSMLAGWSRFY